MNNKYKIIKKLHSGGQGTIFLININNKKYALKIEKIHDKDIKKNLSSSFWREIEFIKTMYKKYPFFFMKLFDYKIKNNYNYLLDNPYNIDFINKLNKCTYCTFKIYDYIPKTLNDIIDKLSFNELYSVLIQIYYIIYILGKNGYTHNDFHINNIGVIKTKNKYIKIFNNNIPTYGINIKLLDYGRVLHKKYKLIIDPFINIHEKKILNFNKILDIRSTIYFLFERPIYKHVSKNFWIKHNDDINIFLNSQELILVDKFVNNIYDKFLLFTLLYPKKYQIKYLKVKKIIYNNIRLPIEDLIFLLNSTHIKSYKDIRYIISYLSNKILI